MDKAGSDDAARKQAILAVSLTTAEKPDAPQQRPPGYPQRLWTTLGTAVCVVGSTHGRTGLVWIVASW